MQSFLKVAFRLSFSNCTNSCFYRRQQKPFLCTGNKLEWRLTQKSLGHKSTYSFSETWCTRGRCFGHFWLVRAWAELGAATIKHASTSMTCWSGTECDSQSAVPKLNVLPLVFAMLPEGHHCLHWHWSVGIGCKCPAESPTMNLNPWKTRPFISAGVGEQRNISFTFRVNPNLIQGTKQEGMARLHCSKQTEHVARDGKILPFSARNPNDRLYGTEKDCKDPWFSLRKGRGEEKKHNWRESFERLVEKNKLKTTFWGTETGTLSHRIMARYKLGCAAAEKTKISGQRPAGSGGTHANENSQQLIKFQGLVLSYILKCCSQSEAWEKCQTCIRLNSNSQVVCGAKMRLYVAGESPVKTAGTCRHRCGFIIIYKSIFCVAMQRRGIFSLFNCDTLEGNNSVWMQCWQAAVKWNGST